MVLLGSQLADLLVPSDLEFLAGGTATGTPCAGDTASAFSWGPASRHPAVTRTSGTEHVDPKTIFELSRQDGGTTLKTTTSLLGDAPFRTNPGKPPAHIGLVLSEWQ